MPCMDRSRQSGGFLGSCVPMGTCGQRWLGVGSEDGCGQFLQTACSGSSSWARTQLRQTEKVVYVYSHLQQGTTRQALYCMRCPAHVILHVARNIMSYSKVDFIVVFSVAVVASCFNFRMTLWL